MWHSRFFRRHPALFHSLHQISPKLTAVVFSSWSLATSKSEMIQYPPSDLSSLYVMAVPCCFLLQRAFSLSAPRFCCWNVLSAPHITTKPPKLRTDRLFFLISGSTPMNPFKRERGEIITKKKKKKEGDKITEKENVTKDVKIPRNVSTFLAGEKATPAVRLGFYNLHTAYTCAHTLSYKHTFIYTYVDSSWILGG